MFFANKSLIDVVFNGCHHSCTQAPTHMQKHEHTHTQYERLKTEGGLSEVHSSVTTAEDSVVPSSVCRVTCALFFCSGLRVCVCILTFQWKKGFFGHFNIY